MLLELRFSQAVEIHKSSIMMELTAKEVPGRKNIVKRAIWIGTSQWLFRGEDVIEG